MTHEHDYVYTLLPWYVTGSLDEKDTNRVNTHLQQCNACSVALQEEIRVAQQLQHELPAMQQLLAQKEQNFSQLKSRLGQSKKNQRWRIKLPQVALLLVFTGFVGFFGARLSTEGEYVTLAHTPPSDAAVLQIVFQPSTTERELRHLLLNGDGKLLGGPSEKGVYRLQLPANVDAARYAKHLREHPATRYVEMELH